MTTFVFLNTETGGLDPTRDALLAIGAVRFEARDGGLYVTDETRWLVRPAIDLTVSRGALRVQGLSWSDLDNPERVHESDAISGIWRYVGGLRNEQIWAHNADFDARFIRALQTRFAGEESADCYRFPDRPSFSCSKALSHILIGRGLLPGVKSSGLQHLAKHFDITVEQAHDALADCHTGVKVLERLWRLAGWL
jgi:DNA polymerase III epsilon subunit-like protein